MKLTLYVCGQRQFGAAAFAALSALPGVTVAGVSAPVFASDGRSPDRLRAVAMAAGIPVLNAGDLRAHTLPDGVDVIVAAHSHDFIGRATRQKARLGAIGYHPSLLPLHRGRDAVRWAVKMGDRVTGGSVYWLDDNIDGGDIAAQEHVFIRRGEDAEDLWRGQLFPLGVALLCRVVSDLARGVIVSVPQDNALATWEPSIDRAPLFRPELPQLGAPPEGFTVVKSFSGVYAGAGSDGRP